MSASSGKWGRQSPGASARLLIWGTYDTGKPRSRILRDGLRSLGVHIDEIHAPVWEGVEDKSQVSSHLARFRLLLRWVLAYPRLAWRLLRAERPDLILVGYPGIPDMFIAALIAKWRGIPVAWDVFLSVYDTVCEDRQLLPPSSLMARVLRRVERTALHLADAVLMDTQAHARRIERLFELESGRCGAVWVGVERGRFYPITQSPVSQTDRPMRVLFYGQFIPLHGIDVIVDAARRLQGAPIEWVLIGRGQEAGRVRDQLAREPLPTLKWVEWVEYNQLNEQLAQADLCLGIFGTSEKAASVIPNKVFQIIAAGRPMVTRDSDAIRELLEPRPGCAYLAPAGDGAALAAVVHEHLQMMRTKNLPASCHESLADRIDEPAVGRQFINFVQRELGLWTTY